MPEMNDYGQRYYSDDLTAAEKKAIDKQRSKTDSEYKHQKAVEKAAAAKAKAAKAPKAPNTSNVRTVPGISGRGGAMVGSLYRPMGGGGANPGQIK